MSDCEICMPIACSHCPELNCPERLCEGTETRARELLREIEDMIDDHCSTYCCSSEDAAQCDKDKLHFATLIAEVQEEAIAAASSVWNPNWQGDTHMVHRHMREGGELHSTRGKR